MLDRRYFLTLGLGAAVAAAASESGWRDVLDVPAQSSPLAARGLFNGLAKAGSRVVAVGQRGHILWSDDHGQNWQQAKVPVSSDLVSVHFPDQRHGWAVGHDAVVLHTQDGGENWSVQLDGRKLGVHLSDAYAAGTPGLTEDETQHWRAEAARFVEQGAENPFLDVWFDSPTHGLAVGAFGLALRTTDGGLRWKPVMHLMANPKALHLYAVRRVAGSLYVVGEQGLALRYDASSDQFKTLSLPYGGTLFGVAGNERVLIVHGLRGNALSSQDQGKSWAPMESGLKVGLTGSASLDGGQLVVVSQAGHILVGDGVQAFKPLQQDRPSPAAAVIVSAPGQLVLAGPRGLRTVEVR